MKPNLTKFPIRASSGLYNSFGFGFDICFSFLRGHFYGSKEGGIRTETQNQEQTALERQTGYIYIFIYIYAIFKIYTMHGELSQTMNELMH